MNDLGVYLIIGAGVIGTVIALLWIHRITDTEGGDDPWRFRRR